MIGTKGGVTKCRTSTRLPESQRWDTFLLHSMKGTHWQPAPGYASDHIPVEISDEGLRPDRTQEDSDDVDYKPVPIDEDHAIMPKIHQRRQTGTRAAHRYWKVWRDARMQRLRASKRGRGTPIRTKAF